MTEFLHVGYFLILETVESPTAAGTNLNRLLPVQLKGRISLQFSQPIVFNPECENI